MSDLIRPTRVDNHYYIFSVPGLHIHIHIISAVMNGPAVFAIFESF